MEYNINEITNEELDSVTKSSYRFKWVDEKVRGNNILDVGFVGDYSKPYAHLIIRKNNLHSNVHGIDIRKDKVNEFKLDNLVCGDAYNMPYKDSSFDVVHLSEVLEHVWFPLNLLKEISRVLRDDGRLFLVVPNPYSYYRFIRFYLLKKHPAKYYRKFLDNHDHKQFYDIFSLTNLLQECSLKVIEFTTTDFIVPKLIKGKILLRPVSIKFFPFNRFGEDLCLIAEKEMLKNEPRKDNKQQA